MPEKESCGEKWLQYALRWQQNVARVMKAAELASYSFINPMVWVDVDETVRTLWTKGLCKDFSFSVLEL